MENELCLIHLGDYLNHIDNKLDMYELLLELVRSVRSDLLAGETAQAMRTLCSYEQNAHVMYENWRVPDEYAGSGDPDDLAQLMENELLPDEGGGETENEDTSAMGRLLRVSEMLTASTRTVLAVVNEIAEFEAEIDKLLNDYEKPENDCAG